MRQQSTMFQTKEQDKTIKEEISEVDISNLPNKDFKIMMVKMFKGLGRRLDKQSKKLEVLNKELENIKNNQIEVNNTVTEILKIH